MCRSICNWVSGHITSKTCSDKRDGKLQGNQASTDLKKNKQTSSNFYYFNLGEKMRANNCRYLSQRNT